MSERLTADAWIDFALATLAREGFEALKADALARKLGVSRGSFYWHFPDLRSFHARMIERWRQKETDAVVASLDRYEAPEQRLNALLLQAFALGRSLEVRMRAWADAHPDAARAVDEIDRRRRDFIEGLLIEAGMPPRSAADRARILYWCYLGAAWTRNKVKGDPMKELVGELQRMVLTEPGISHARDASQ